MTRRGWRGISSAQARKQAVFPGKFDAVSLAPDFVPFRYVPVCDAVRLAPTAKRKWGYLGQGTKECVRRFSYRDG